MKILLLPILLPFLTVIANGDDWPQWRGVRHDGISTEKGLKFPEGEPRIVWKASVGEGFSGMTVAAGRLFTMGLTDGQKMENVYCLDAKSGKELWKYSNPTDYRPQFYEGGSHGTPTVDGDHVYVMGLRGQLVCLKADSGAVVWSKELTKEIEGLKIGLWGLTGAILVDGDNLILSAGTFGCAVNKADGKMVWTTGNGDTGYAAPIPFSHEGKDYVAMFGGDALAAVERKSGKVAWTFPWKTQYRINAADPIIAGDVIFISSGYDQGATALKLGGSGVTQLWVAKEPENQMNPGILINGHIYSHHKNADKKPTFTCTELATGKLKWKQSLGGMGSVIGADGKLLILSEAGEVIVGSPNPDKWEEITRFQVLPKKCWTLPTLANGVLHCRNWKGQIVAVQLN